MNIEFMRLKEKLICLVKFVKTLFNVKKHTYNTVLECINIRVCIYIPSRLSPTGVGKDHDPPFVTLRTNLFFHPHFLHIHLLLVLLTWPGTLHTSPPPLHLHSLYKFILSIF